MESNVLRGVVRYDGTGFSGWQNQAGQRTVQGELEAAMARIAGEPVAVQGAGRTDAGVHALGQVFSCTWPRAVPGRLRQALCSMLAPEISITSIETAPPDFNARFSAHSKRYVYVMHFSPWADPFSCRYAWQVPHRVDLDMLQSLLPRLEGAHDFGGFQSSGTQMKTSVRTLYSVHLEPGGVVAPHESMTGHYRLIFHGDGFLYKMVRNITGTLVEIARGRFPAEFLDQALASGGPFLGHCAPARGLFLDRVFYGEAEAANDNIEVQSTHPPETKHSGGEQGREIR